MSIDKKVSQEEVAQIRAELDVFNAQQTGRDDFQPLRLVLRDAEGEVIAGLVGQTGWDWLYVEVMWVHESRRREGLGTRLIDAAEETARQRGCSGACLSTFSFQALPFYRRRGYLVFGQIDDYPPGETMFFMQKRFAE